MSRNSVPAQNQTAELCSPVAPERSARQPHSARRPRGDLHTASLDLPGEITVQDGADPRWDSTLSQFADASYDQSDFLAAHLWGERRLSKLTLTQDGKLIGAAQAFLFQLPHAIGAPGTAYVKFGPLWRLRDGTADIDNYAATCRALIAEYAIRRRLCLTIVPGADPIHGDAQQEVLADLGFARRRAVTASTRYLVDASLSEEDQRKSLSAKWRYNLKKAEQSQLDIRFCADTDAAPDFMRLHDDMRRRKSYRDATWVDDYLCLMPSIPQDLRPFVVLAYSGSEPVAGAVVGQVGDTAVYLFGGSNAKGLAMRAGYKLQWQIVCELMRRPCVRWYDLDNDASGNPGLRQFKAGLVGRAGKIYELPGEFEYCVDLRSRLVSDVIQTTRSARNMLRNALKLVR